MWMGHEGVRGRAQCGVFRKKEKKRVCGGVVVCTGEFHGLCRSSYFFLFFIH